MLTYEEMMALVRQDFKQFSPGNIESICLYNKNRHIEMTTDLALQKYVDQDGIIRDIWIEDFIHGLNHIFFNGFDAGVGYERNSNEGAC